MLQNYTSANTSVNSTKVPAVFRMADFREGTLNLDLGGGKYDTATYFLAKRGVVNEIIDPYNRSEAENAIAEWSIEACGGADTCTISNVLNVINSRNGRISCLMGAWARMKVGGICYITVYEGDRSGVGRETKKDCWQNNKKLKDYYSEVYEVFGNAHILGKMIVAVK